MAGTSPDRSKRYESSTESTSGSEPAVPDPGDTAPARPSAPDPRLSMSRPTAPKPDQATAVFSRRALLEATEPESAPPDATEPSAPGRGDTTASDTDELDAGSDAAGSGSAGAATGLDADAGDSGSDAAGSGGGAGSAGAATGLDADAGDAGSDTGSVGKAAGSAPDAGGSDGSTEARADEDGSSADDDEAAAAGSTAEDEAEDGEAQPHARGAAAAPAARPTTAAEPGEGASPDADADADADVRGDGALAAAGATRAADTRDRDAADGQAAPVDAAQAAAEAARAADARGESDMDVQGPDAPEAAPVDAVQAAAEAARAADARDGGAAGGQAAAAAAAASVDAVQAGAARGEADTDVQDPETSEAAPVDAVQAVAEAARAADARDEGAAGGQAAAEAAPVDAAQAAAEAAQADVRDADPSADVPVDEPKAAHAAGVGGVRGGAAGDGAEAADEAEAPQGPPAGDDESRTGGAGGESGGEGGAEAGRGVDQPTAIFRAPRVPAVDQPTTMLKLGSVPKPTAEPDAGAKGAAEAGAAPGAKGAGASEGAGKAEGAGGAKGTHDAEGAGGDAGRAEAAAAPAEAAPPAERTSKFVALKRLDEPPAVAPAEATRALPQVGPERTTQQPLPPKPPLDLLAELTNTPPPRQTPVRTLVRRVKIWTPLAILLVIVFAIAQAVRPLPAPSLTLTADESYAFKGEKVSLPWPAEGQGWMDVNGIGTVDSFGEQKPVAIGSVAKAMTAYVILKEHPMKPGAKGATIPVDAKAETEGGYDKDGESTLNTVKEGDQLSQYDAIAAIMIPSANNIARLLARWDSNGSEEEFVKKMNAAAKDLGMTNTTYTDPSGLKETTVSTAEDQVKLGNELVKMKALTDITRLPSWKDPSGQPWSNYNRLVPYNNAIGIKTGSTTAAGGNLLFAGTQEVGGETAIVVGAILGQHTPPIIDTVNAVSKTAMIAAQDALTSDTILKKGDVVGYVDDGLGGHTPVVVTKNVSAVGWAGKTVRIELDTSATIAHEAKSGTEVGKLIVGEGSGEGVKVPVALQQDLTEPGFLTKLTRVS